MSAPFGGVPTRWEPDRSRQGGVALVLPGSGYSPAHPILEFARQALLQHGWTVQQVWWDAPRGLDDDATAAWVCHQARAALDAEAPRVRQLLVAKSLGTLAAPVAAERGLPAIWFTPLFAYEPSIQAIRDNAEQGSSQLLVGGTADEAWDAARAREIRCRLLELPSASHFLHVPDDHVKSVELQLAIAHEVESFLDGLDDQ